MIFMLTWFYCSKLTFLHYAIVHKNRSYKNIKYIKLTNHTFLNSSVTLHKQFIKWFYLVNNRSKKKIVKNVTLKTKVIAVENSGLKQITF